MFVRLSLAAVMAVVPIVAFAAPEPITPAATPSQLGAIELIALADANNVVPNDGKVFGADQSPGAVAAVLRAAGAPTDRVTLSVDALLVKLPGHVVLIDTGLGPKVGGILPRSLAVAGVTPAQITDVLITHSHPDHIGGLIDAQGRSAFPNAKIRLSAAEWRWLQDRKATESIVAAIAPQVVSFTPGTAILPGITPVAITGHTPGHVGYQIESQGQRLFDTGDTAHSAIVSLARPGWAIGYDTDKPAGEAARKATLARLASSGERVWAPHFPYPGFGKIVAKGPGYAFVADK